MPNKQQVENGRQAVDAYRAAHSKLHSKRWTRSIPSEHTPLLEQMLKELNKQGFNSLDEFFDASNDFNAQELGFASVADCIAQLKDRSKYSVEEAEAKWEELKSKWK